MRRFQFNKLIRDKIIINMERQGAKPKLKKLSDNEYRAELLRKMHEELTEVRLDKPKEIIDELADLQEVIDALTIAIGSSIAKRNEIQKNKHTKLGGFAGRTYVENVLVADDSEWIAYYKERPDRNPELPV